MRIGPVNWRRTAVHFAVVIVLFVVIGPFGTYGELTFLGRLSYWVVMIGACGLFFHTAVAVAIRHPRLATWPRLRRLTLGVVLAAIPATAVVMLQDKLWRGDEVAGVGWFYTTVLVVGFIMSFVNFMPPFMRIEELETEHAVDTETVPFLKRLPAELGVRLVSLSMNDHYVRVETQAGSTLLLMRFKDAMEEVRTYPGHRIHRSHWVAADAVDGVVRKGRRWKVLTVKGGRLPASASYERQLARLKEQTEHRRAATAARVDGPTQPADHRNRSRRARSSTVTDDAGMVG